MEELVYHISFGYHRKLQNCHHLQLLSLRVGSLYKLCPNVIEAPWFRFQSGSTILVNPMLFGSGEIPREPISDLLVEEDFKQIKTSPRPFCRECHCCNMSIKCLN